MAPLEWTFLGRVEYGRALSLQAACARRVAMGGPPRLLLLEHPNVITLGRSADRTHLCLSEAEYARRGIGLYQVARGGDVTCHGPGQLVGYPVASLDQAGVSVPAWVEGHARAIIAYAARQGVLASWSPIHPGVYAGGDKLAALGFHISRRVSTHGFALNVDPDLGLFETIVPCGLTHCGVTSLARLGVSVPPMSEVAAEVAELVAAQFGFALKRPLPALEVLEEASEGAPAMAL